MLRRFILPLALCLTIQGYSWQSWAIGKEFITSCTYGVLAGTLVGAATLAFTENPGDNLGRIARGASIGLYAGILLGFYVTYGVAAVDESYEDATNSPRYREPKLAVFPLIEETGVSGIAAQWQVLRF